MDRDFHNDDFERLLREKSNEFRMYPTNRVWHSIYNNIHPGRKWPSVAMSITLITALLLVGYLNTRNANSPVNLTNTTFQQNIKIAQTIPNNYHSPFLNGNAGNLTTMPGAVENTKATSTVPISSLNSGVNKNNEKVIGNPSPKSANNSNLQPSNIDKTWFASGHPINNSPANSQTIYPNENVINSVPELTEGTTTVVGTNNFEAASVTQDQGILTYVDNKTVTHQYEQASMKGNLNRNIHEKMLLLTQEGSANVVKNNLASNKPELISVEDKFWIENYALYNRPATKKWANKLAWQVYATPSMVYRKLSNQPAFNNTITATPFAISTSTQDINKTVNQIPALGLEVGSGIQYGIAKNLKIKAGLQLNFTRYNSDAFLNSHPVTTLLTMHDFKTNTSYLVSRSTPFSNKSGLEAVRLHNETFQISLPMGVDIKLLGGDNVQWNIGATIQPTYVAGGKSYLISSDRLNYVKETSMLNRWNLNAGFETNITYKAKGLTYQIGPQFRTQVYSTNSKNYAVEEKLVNFGLKFGISKTIK